MNFTDPAQKFAWLWVHALNAQNEVVTEHAFHPTRKWKFDYAHVQTKVAIEIEGGVSHRLTSKTGKKFLGHHVSKDGYENDCEKYNEAQRLGWRVFRLTPAMVNATELQKISDFIKQQPILN